MTMQTTPTGIDLQQLRDAALACNDAAGKLPEIFFAYQDYMYALHTSGDLPERWYLRGWQKTPRHPADFLDLATVAMIDVGKSLPRWLTAAKREACLECIKTSRAKATTFSIGDFTFSTAHEAAVGKAEVVSDVWGRLDNKAQSDWEPCLDGLRLRFTSLELPDLRGEIEAEYRAAIDTVTGTAVPPNGTSRGKPPRAKKQTRGKYDDLIESGLCIHHGYDHGAVSQEEPIGERELGRRVGVSKSTVHRWFKGRFPGRREGYERACLDHTLGLKLAVFQTEVWDPRVQQLLDPARDEASDDNLD